MKSIDLKYHTLYDVLKDTAEKSINQGTGVYYIDGNGNEIFQLYENLFTNARSILSQLYGNNIKKGDKLIFQFKNEFQFVNTFWACIIGGIIPVPVKSATTNNTSISDFKKLIGISKQIEKFTIITETEIRESLFPLDEACENMSIIVYEELIKQNHPTVTGFPYVESCDLALIQYSSGSTGDPKGVQLTHYNLVHNLNDMIVASNVTDDDFVANWMPLTHDMGLIALHMMSLFGSINQFIVSPNTFIRKTFLFLQKVTKHKATIMGAPNFAVSWMFDKVSDTQLKELNLKSVRIIYNGAEPISVKKVREFMNRFAECGLNSSCMYTVYGMAESSVAVAFPKQHEFNTVLIERELFSKKGIVKIYNNADAIEYIELADEGYPMPTMEVNIIDQLDAFVGERIVGEIVIKGPNVTKGYYNNPIANKALYVNGFLRTGDLGFIHNGRLIVTGRKKDIIFVNGQNHYPHDLELLASEIDEVEQRNIVFVGSNNLDEGVEKVIGFFVYRKKLSSFVEIADKIKIHLFKRLGIRIHNIIPVPSIPKTTSGKIQRYKFSKNYEEGKYDKIITQIESIELNQFTLYSNEAIDCQFENSIEREKVGDIIKYLKTKLETELGVLNIQTDKNLILYGLDSIKTVELAFAIEQELSVKLSPSTIINQESIEKIALYCYKAGNDQNNVSEASKVKLVQELDKKHLPFQLTDIQFAYWLGRGVNFELGNNGCHAYQEINCESLDVERFEIAWNRLIQRHDMLRAKFNNNGQQQISQTVPYYTIKRYLLQNDSESIREEQLLKVRSALSHKVYEVTQWPLFTIEISELNDNQSRVHFSIDLLIADLWSIQILFRELHEIYTSEQPNIHNIELSFRDYILYEDKQRYSNLYHDAKDYWMKRLKQLPPAPEFPLLKKPSELKKPLFLRRQAQISNSDWHSFKQIAQEKGLTPSNALLSIFADVLSKWSKNQDFTLNVTFFNRPQAHDQIKDIVGDFTSVLPIDFHFSQPDIFISRAKEVQKRLFEHIEHRFFNGVEVIRELAREDGKELQAILPVIFTSAIGNGNEGIDDSISKIGEVGYGISQTPQVILDHQVYEGKDFIVLRWDTVDALFPEGVLDTMFDIYVKLVVEFSKNQVAWQKNNVIDLPVEQKRKRLSINQTEYPVSENLLFSKFIVNAIKNPSNLAIITKEKTLTYRELINYAWSLSVELKLRGVQKNNLVAIYMNNGWEQVVATLGIIMAGAAYLPLSADLPLERVNCILQDSDVEIVVKQNGIDKKFKSIRCVIDINSLRMQAFDIHNFKIQQNNSDLAYVIYTSGSTGFPKGVMIDHKGALNTIDDINDKFKVSESDRIIALSALNFDLSVYDIFGALNVGACIVIPEAITRKDPSHWLHLIKSAKVSIWNSVPALMEMFVTYLHENNKELPNSLRLVLMSGDWIPVKLPKKIKELKPDIEIISLGGATEASIWSIYHPITEVNEKWKSIPYGLPLRNQKLYVLNSKMEDCPDYVSGDLYIAGHGLALEYKNDKKKTDEAFIFHPEKNERLYKTGDLGRYLPNGNIEFLGREDGQVKINGYRIELGEIEKILTDDPNILESVVLVNETSTKNKQLVAFITFKNGKELVIEELKSHISALLPEYMVPGHYHQVSSIPLTSNGKVDRKKLLQLVENIDSYEEFKAPNTKIEEILANIFSEIIGIDKIGIHHNFFDIGASSLQIVRAQAKINDAFNKEVPIIDLFQHSNIKSLALLLKNGDNGDALIIEGQKRSDLRKNLGRNRVDRQALKN